MVCVIWIVFKRAKGGKPNMVARNPDSYREQGGIGYGLCDMDCF